jgi:hypothetical protein
MAKKSRRILSPSEISCFRDCRMKWYFSYVERRRTFTVGRARKIGLLVHSGLASWYSHQSIGDCHQAIEAAATKYEAPKDVIDLAKGIFEHYIVYYETDLSLYEPLIIETKISERAVGLKCIPDLVFLELTTGKYYIIDHKVSTDLEINKVFDVQKIALFKVISERYPISGIIYNMIRSKVPLIPEPLKNRTRLKKFAPASTTESVFRKALKVHKFKAVDYPDVVRFYKENENQFFSRVPVEITLEEIEDFEKQEEIVRKEIAGGVIYMNRQWDCERMCDYYEDCHTRFDKDSKVILSKEGLK